MSTGKKLYLDPLTEDNFSQLWDNSDGSTIVLNFEEPLYQDRFTDADVKLDMFSAYRDKFTNSQTDVSWVTPGTSYPSDEEIWYGHKMPCPDMICKSPFPWAKRVSYEMVRVGPTIEEHNWPSDVDVKPCKLFSCFINKIQGKDHRLANMSRNTLLTPEIKSTNIMNKATHTDYPTTIKYCQIIYNRIGTI
jgi:hypothetical protein